MTQALRTPDDRFADLPGYPFAPNYLGELPGYEGLRMHYVDEGSRDAGSATFLCLHGQPSWSYLYRRMIPILGQAGRVIAPDLFGFGRSDKPVDEGTYSFDFHRNALLAFVEALDLRNVTLVVQDWGGLLGLTLPMEAPERYARLIVMNTALATGETPLGDGFLMWRAFNKSQPDLDLAALFRLDAPILTDAEAAAYAAPYPDATYKAGVRAFPEIVPDGMDAPGAATSRRARDWWASKWRGESFMAVGLRDPVLGPPAMALLRSQIPGCPLPLELPDAGHFVQEYGEPVARAALAAFAKD